MFQPGGLVRIKSANENWQHLIDRLAVFVNYEPDTPFPYSVKPLDCACQVRFDEEDLEYICNGQKVAKIIGELKYI